MGTDLLHGIPDRMRESFKFKAPVNGQDLATVSHPSTLGAPRVASDGQMQATPPMKRKPLPIDLRVYVFIQNVLMRWTVPQMLRMASMWFRLPLSRMLQWYPKGRMVVTLHLAPKVDAETFIIRQGICKDCDSRVIGNGKHAYCKDCGCPQRWYARLTWKNRLGGQHCPLRKHPGEYPNYHQLSQPQKTCGGRGG